MITVLMNPHRVLSLDKPIKTTQPVTGFSVCNSVFAVLHTAIAIDKHQTAARIPMDSDDDEEDNDGADGLI